MVVKDPPKNLKRAVPFDFRLGVGAFGWLIYPDGAGFELIESVRWDERTMVFISMETGARRRMTWRDTDHLFVEIKTEQVPLYVAMREHSGDYVPMPAPVFVKVGSDERRIDPFHSDRHLNLEFRQLVALIQARNLPTSYGAYLVTHCQEDVPPPIEAHVENAEQFAANLSEMRSREPSLSFAESLERQLRYDAVPDSDEQFASMCERFGWAAVLDQPRLALGDHLRATPYAVAA